MSLFTGIRLPLLIGAALIVVYAVALGSPYHVRLLTLAGIYALLAIGYHVVFGLAGALSLTQGAFFGLGGYVTAILAGRLGWDATATFPLSIALPVVVAAVIAVPVLHLDSHYFALATLGIGQVLLLVAIKWESLTGGSNGLTGVPGIALAGVSVPSGWPLLVVVWGLVALGAGLAWWLARGLTGRAFHLMRAQKLAAQAIGLDVGRLRLIALLVSAGYAGAAGALQVHTMRLVSTEILEFPVMVACLAMTVVGGRTRISGAILGALLLVHLPEWLRGLDRFYLIGYGALLLATIVAAPFGLTGALERLRARWFPEPAALAPPSIAVPAARAVRTDAPLLVVHGLAKAFGGVRALASVDLAVAPGEIVGLIGPNGSGKTTLLNLVTGVERPDAGTVALDGRPIGGLAVTTIARAGVARSFQTPALADDMSVLDAVAVARRHDRGLRIARGRAMALLGRLGLAEHALQPCARLAPAQRRRVELARALATSPRLLLLDEPAAGLGAAEQRDLALRLRDLAHADGIGLLVIEHDIGFLSALADRLVCLVEGSVIAAGTPASVRADPRVREAYLGASA